MHQPYRCSKVTCNLALFSLVFGFLHISQIFPYHESNNNNCSKTKFPTPKIKIQDSLNLALTHLFSQIVCTLHPKCISSLVSGAHTSWKMEFQHTLWRIWYNQRLAYLSNRLKQIHSRSISLLLCKRRIEPGTQVLMSTLSTLEIPSFDFCAEYLQNPSIKTYRLLITFISISVSRHFVSIHRNLQVQ